MVCFSSRRVVDAVAADPIFRPLVTEMGEVRKFATREIFQSAVDRRLDVALNPFHGVARRFTQDELREVLDARAGAP